MSQPIRSCLQVSEAGLHAMDGPSASRFEWHPGDGYRYVVYTAALPFDVDGGGADTHRLVTLYEPLTAWYGHGQSYILQVGVGELVASYLHQRFPGLAKLEPSMQLEAMRLIGTAVGRDVWDHSEVTA